MTNISLKEKSSKIAEKKNKIDVADKIKYQIQSRLHNKPHIGLKINLYKAYELEALSKAMHSLNLTKFSPVECVMVGDSYFMTHLGKKTTKLNTKEEQQWGLTTIVSLIQEVSVALKKLFPDDGPYLVGDMPDGFTNNVNEAISASEHIISAGADVVKIEISSIESLRIVEMLVKHNFKIMAHIGYTPQQNQLKRYGDSFQDALNIFSTARKLRDYGACSIVLEMISETVNRALCSNLKDGIPIYSIFSGSSQCGGQSLNVWDAVFKPSFPSQYFPPTAEYSRTSYPGIYTADVISSKLCELIELTLSGKFPLTPTTRMTLEEQENILLTNPWVNSNISISLNN